MTEQQTIFRNIEAGNNKLICQEWIWKERGWDDEEDGFSLHLSYDALNLFIKDYWDSMPDIRPAPDEYSAPYSEPYEIGVNDETHFEVSLLGSMRYGGDPPAKLAKN